MVFNVDFKTLDQAAFRTALDKVLDTLVGPRVWAISLREGSVVAEVQADTAAEAASIAAQRDAGAIVVGLPGGGSAAATAPSPGSSSNGSSSSGANTTVIVGAVAAAAIFVAMATVLVVVARRRHRNSAAAKLPHLPTVSQNPMFASTSPSGPSHNTMDPDMYTGRSVPAAGTAKIPTPAWGGPSSGPAPLENFYNIDIGSGDESPAASSASTA